MTRRLQRISALATVVIAGAAVWAVRADDKPKAAKASPLDKIKALAGEWSRTDDSKGEVGVVYRVVSAGSAVMEDLFPGSDHEMISMYHMDGDALMMTHYCAAGNQPRMKVKVSKSDSFEFDFVDGTNIKPGDAHMHAMKMTLVDADHFKQAWTYMDKGKAETHDFEWARKKK